MIIFLPWQFDRSVLFVLAFCWSYGANGGIHYVVFSSGMFLIFLFVIFALIYNFLLSFICYLLLSLSQDVITTGFRIQCPLWL